jgi:tRNA pseudouridine55 synthase
MGYNFEQGEVICIDKPLNWTSFDVVGKLRGLLKYKFGVKFKVGHAGTLDPLATGLLIICTGKMTKQIDKIQASEKEYIATIELGKTTPSYDLETEVDNTFPVNHITRELVEEKLKLFLGEIDQVPPIFSAKFINGKRAYELAREGKKIELEANKVVIKELDIIDFQLPVLKIRVVCSKGTYIRSLAHDIGKALQSGAHLVALRRTASGQFKVEDADTIESFSEKINAISVQKAI